MGNRRKTGTEYEQKTAEYLESLGWKILERNYRCRIGEIDLIALDGRTLVFVEVKYRFSMKAGNAWEAVDKKKQKIISKVAAQYLAIHFHTLDIACRFDVVGFEKDKPFWIKNAFDFCV